MKIMVAAANARQASSMAVSPPEIADVRYASESQASTSILRLAVGLLPDPREQFRRHFGARRHLRLRPPPQRNHQESNRQARNEGDARDQNGQPAAALLRRLLVGL